VEEAYAESRALNGGGQRLMRRKYLVHLKNAKKFVVNLNQCVEVKMLRVLCILTEGDGEWRVRIAKKHHSDISMIPTVMNVNAEMQSDGACIVTITLFLVFSPI
jgi:hypothetical protein